MNRILSIAGAMSVLGLVALAACTASTSPSDEPTEDESGDEQELRKSVGKKCGGIAGLRCAKGLNCHLAGRYPDAMGKCVKPPAGAAGSLCGGRADIQCNPGLYCQLPIRGDGGMPPGAMGMPVPNGGPPAGAVGLPAPPPTGTCASSGPPPGAMGMPIPPQE